jgi:hypothetical protein
VDERVLAWVDAGLRRKLDAALREVTVRSFDEVELLGDIGEKSRHLVS